MKLIKKYRIQYQTTYILKIYLAILFFTCSTVLKIYCQAPEAFSYQAIVRDSSGDLLINTKLKLRVSIFFGTPNGDAEYVEIHDIQTNQFGIANIKIGTGDVMLGEFSAIKWSTGNYFLRIEVSRDNKPFSILGTTSLLSVPYALYSNSAGSIKSSDTSYNKSSQTLGMPGPTGPTGPTGTTRTLPDQMVHLAFREYKE